MFNLKFNQVMTHEEIIAAAQRLARETYFLYKECNQNHRSSNVAFLIGTASSNYSDMLDSILDTFEENENA